MTEFYCFLASQPERLSQNKIRDMNYLLMGLYPDIISNEHRVYTNIILPQVGQTDHAYRLSDEQTDRG